MKIGLCSSDFRTRMDCETLFGKMAECGFKVTQFGMGSVTEIEFDKTPNMEIPWSVDDDIIKKILDVSQKYGIEIIACNGTYNMTHPDPKLREEGAARFKGFAEAVRKLGAKYISLCSGTRCPDDMWVAHPDNETPEAWNDMFESMRKIVKIAEDNNLVLAIETEAGNIINTPEKARKIMDDIGSDALKMIIDCANLFHIGKAHKDNVRPTLKHAFECFGKDIVLAHGKDILDTDGINYCPTGDGIIDYPYFIELLRQYEYKGDMLLHSIYDEEKMIPCRKVIEQYL